MRCAKQKDVFFGKRKVCGFFWKVQTFLCRFFGIVRLFFRNFLKCLQWVHLRFFLFCKRKDVQKFPKSSFYIFRHYATYRRSKKFRKKFEMFLQFFPHAGTVEENTRHSEVLLLFLSLRYGADLGRSWLVFPNFDVEYI